MLVFISGEFRKNLASLSILFAPSAGRRFQFDKRRQRFISARAETLSVTAMHIRNPDRSPVGINRCEAAPTPTCFTQIIRDDFPALFREMFPR
jgi:hypothetical protein